MRTLAVILSGGSSSRFQVPGEKWVDKALYPLRGKPMVAHVLEKAEKLADEVVIAVRDRERAGVYERLLGTPAVLDDERLPGPLGGVLGALRSRVCERVLILPNDTPYLDTRLLEHLLSALELYDVSSPILPNGLIATTVTAARCETALWVLEEVARYPGRSRIADLHRGAPRVALLNARARGVPALSLLSINRRELLDKTEASYPEGLLEGDVIIERHFGKDDVKLKPSSLAGSLWGTLAGGLYMEEFRLYLEKGALMLAAYTLLDSPSPLARAAGRMLVGSLKEVS